MISKFNRFIFSVSKGAGRMIRIISKGLRTLFRAPDLVIATPLELIVENGNPDRIYRITYIGSSSFSANLDDFTAPDWITLLSAAETVGNNRNIITLALRANNNTSLSRRTGDIILRNNMASITIQATQPAASDYIGVQFSLRSTTPPTYSATAADIPVNGVTGTQVTLWVFTDGTSETRFTIESMAGQLRIGDSASGVAISNSTIYTIPNGTTAFPINMFAIPGGDQTIAAAFTINPENTFTIESNVTTSNGLLRSSALSGVLSTTLAGAPVPGNDFTLDFDVSGATTPITFALYGTQGDRTAGTNPVVAGVTQTPTSAGTSRWSPTVAVAAGTDGAARSTVFWGRATEGAGATQEVVDIQITITSAQMTFTSAEVIIPTPTWNTTSGTYLVGSDSGTASRTGTAPLAWNVNDVSVSLETTQGDSGSPTLTGVTAGVDSGGADVILTQFTKSVNSSPVTATVSTATFRYNYPTTTFTSLIGGGVNIGTSQITFTARPRVPMTAFDTTINFDDSDGDAMTTVMLVLDTGSSIASANSSTEAQHPLVDPASTPFWMDDTDQTPTNAQLEDGTAVASYRSNVTDAQRDALETLVPSIFDSNGTRSLLPYAGIYSVVLRTNDETTGATSGRNTNTSSRTAQVVVQCVNF